MMFPRYVVAAMLAGAMLACANEDHEGGNGADHRSRRLSSTYKLTFEGVGDGVRVANYYNGAGGPKYRIVFGSTMYTAVDSDNGGYGPIANEPSPSTIMGIFEETGNFTRGSYVTVNSGFTYLSFMYSSAAPVNVSVYSGPDRTGRVLDNLVIPPTGVCGVGGIPACGDPTGNVGIWENFEVVVPGIARSAGFFAPSNLLSTIAFDDMIIEQCTTYVVYDASTKAPVREIVDGSLVCLPRSYNIRAFPCVNPGTQPVWMTLKNKKGRVVRITKDSTDPYFLYGGQAKPNVIKPSPGPLKPGMYTLTSSVGGSVTFTNGRLDRKGICKM